MEMRYFERRKGRIEIIPMIDVMFFLLVFFVILTLQMIPDAGLNLKLPTAGTTQHLPPKPVVVNIPRDGPLQVDGHAMTLGELTARLQANDPAHASVTIAADRKLDFQRFVSVMDAVRSAGVSDIGIASQPQPGPR